jgi:hypothetical protein
MLIGCNNKNDKSKNANKSDIRYEFERQMIIYEFDNNVTQEVEIYVNKQNDTFGNQIKFYKDNVLDSSKSRFYNLDIKEKSEPNIYKGEVVYHFDKKADGELESYKLNMINFSKDSMIEMYFDENDLVDNKISFEFKSTNDTIIGQIHALHFKEKDDKDSIRVRRVLLSVDNYTKTNNPFVNMTLK